MLFLREHHRSRNGILVGNLQLELASVLKLPCSNKIGDQHVADDRWMVNVTDYNNVQQVSHERVVVRHVHASRPFVVLRIVANYSVYLQEHNQ